MKGAKQHLAQHIEAAKEALGKTELPTIQLEKITDLNRSPRPLKNQVEN